MGQIPEDERPVEMMGDVDEATERGRPKASRRSPRPSRDRSRPPSRERSRRPSPGDRRGDAAGHRDADAERPAAAADRGPVLLDAVVGLGDRLSRRLDAIQAILEREARAEATRERVIDRLHAELQEYKQDLLLKVQRPIFVDLIQLHDDIGKMIEARSAADAEPDRATAVRGILESIQVAIEDILYRQGVEPFTAEGDAVRPRRQRAVATVATDDPAQQDHRRPAAQGVPGRRQADPAGDSLGLHAPPAAADPPA